MSYLFTNKDIQEVILITFLVVGSVREGENEKILHANCLFNSDCQSPRAQIKICMLAFLFH